MFQLDPDDEGRLLQETARQFAADVLEPAVRSHESAREVGVNARRLHAEIGFSGLEWPESLGGAGLGPEARALLNEELGAADPGAALALDGLGAALYPLIECGGDAALERFGRPILDEGGARAHLVFAEETALSLSPERATGLVEWVPGDRADLLVVVSSSAAFVIQDGLELEQLRGAGLRAAGAAAIHLSGAPVLAHWELPQPVARARARARIYAASLAVGVLRGVCTFAQAYAQQREAFGRPIAHHQALAFLLTDMQMAVDGARLLVHEAAWRSQARQADRGAAAAAFAETIEAGAFVGPNGVQILGGHGFMQDYPVEKAMRELRSLGILFGGLDSARSDAAVPLFEASGALPLSVGEPEALGA